MKNLLVCFGLILFFSVSLSAQNLLDVEGGIEVDSQQINNLIAFAARTIASTQITTFPSYNSVTGWSTNSQPSLFSNASFNAGTGVFTAPRDGFYFFTASIRLENLNGGAYYRVGFNLNGGSTLFDWLTQNLFYSQDDVSFRSLVITSIAKLNKGDTIAVVVYNDSDSSLFISNECFFSGYSISDF